MDKNEVKEIIRQGLSKEELIFAEATIEELYEDIFGIPLAVHIDKCKVKTNRKSDDVKIILKLEAMFNINDFMNMKFSENVEEQKLEEVYLEEEES